MVRSYYSMVRQKLGVIYAVLSHIHMIQMLKILTLKNMYKGMVPDDTVHKGNSKRHKEDEKGTHFVVQFSPSVFGIFEIS